MAEEIARQRVLAAAVFTFNGGNLQVGRSHLSLREQLAPDCAYADEVDECGFGVELNEREAGGSGVLDLSGTLHGSQCASLGTSVCRIYTWFIDGSGESMKRIRGGISTVEQRTGGKE